MSVTKSKPIEELDQARLALEAAISTRDKIIGRAKDALASPEAYATWRLDLDAASLEVDRRTLLVAELDEPAERQREIERDQAFRKRYAERNKANVPFAARIVSDLNKIYAIALPLLRDTALAEKEEIDLNANLPDDLQPIVPANILARCLPLQPYREISREPILVWVKQGTDFIIEDETLVKEVSNGLGVYRTGSGFGCERRTAFRVSFQAPVASERPGPLWDIRIPSPNSPGNIFDGTNCRQPLQVLAQLQRSTQPQQREVEVRIELGSPPQAASRNEDGE